MKKYLCSIVALGLFGAVSATESPKQAQKEAKSEEQNSEVIEKSVEKVEVEAEIPAGKEAYAGGYVAAGIGFDMTRNQALLNDNLIDNARNITPAHNLSFGKKNFKRVDFALAAGYGDFVSESFYLGAEVALDLMPSKTASFTDAQRGDSKLKVRTFVPSVALRLGQYLSCCDSVVYEKLGFAVIDSRFTSALTKDEVVKTRRISPLIGLGLEKNVCENCNVKFEMDYRFGASRVRKDLTVFAVDGTDTGQKCDVKNKVRGYVIRLMFTYNFGTMSSENN